MNWRVSKAIEFQTTAAPGKSLIIMKSTLSKGKNSQAKGGHDSRV